MSSETSLYPIESLSGDLPLTNPAETLAHTEVAPIHELDDALVDERFSAIVEAEEVLALENPEESRRRMEPRGDKPNSGFDIKQMQPVHAVMSAE